VIEHPALAGILTVAFDAVWHEALTLEQVTERHTVELRSA
jgi:hypothetical protein